MGLGRPGILGQGLRFAQGRILLGQQCQLLAQLLELDLVILLLAHRQVVVLEEVIGQLISFLLGAVLRTESQNILRVGSGRVHIGWIETGDRLALARIRVKARGSDRPWATWDNWHRLLPQK